ncbi:MAG: hypothetical protein AB1454_09335 [Candidatus Auribacterota bacterium]
MMFRKGNGKLRSFVKLTALLVIQAFLLSQGSLGIAATPDKLMFNEKYGRVRDSFKGEEDRMIIHIQDAHCVYEAQQNIVALISELYKNHNVRLVTVEGADAYFNVDELASYPISSVKQDVSDYFMKNGRISAVEYMLIQDELPMAVRGAESRDLYVDNFNAFMQCLPKENDVVSKLIDNIDQAYENLKNVMLNNELKELDYNAQRYQDGSLQFVDYASYLIEKAEAASIDLKEFENFSKLIAAQDKEGNIDFAKIHVELTNLIDALSGRITKDQLTQLLNKNLFYKIGKIPPHTFFSFLKELYDEVELDVAAYPNLTEYTDYLTMYQSIDDIAITNELNSLEAKIKDSLFESDEQKDLLVLSHDITILKKLINLKVSKTELKYFRDNKDAFTEERFVSFLLRHLPTYQIPFDFSTDYTAISSRLPVVDAFYKVANKRNDSLIENTIAEMDLEDTNIAVLITGGFHTEGICDILKEQGISYQVISPSITEQPGNTQYLARLTGVPTELEEVLGSNRLQIPLVLADPAIIPESADRQSFLTAFKTLLNTHPDGQDLLRILDEEPTGYQPGMTFLDSFSIGEEKYVSYNLNGRKFFMKFVPGDSNTVIAGAQSAIGEIGKYAFAFIKEDVFTAAASDENRKLIDARSGLDSRIEQALARGDVISVDQKDQQEIAQLVGKGLLTPESSAEGVRPTVAFLVNSRVSALVVQAKVALVDAFSNQTQDVLRSRGIQKLESFSNVTDLTVDDARVIDEKLGTLLDNGKLELPSGKVVRSVVQGGIAQVYAVTPEGPSNLRPQLVINDSIFRAMLPSVEQEGVQVVDAAKLAQKGYIDVNAGDRTVTLYSVNDQGERTIATDVDGKNIQVHLQPNITSADILEAILQVRRAAAEQEIGLIGYGNPADGIGISFDNLGVLFDAATNADTVRAFTNVYRLLSQAPSLQDIDLTDIGSVEELKNYLLQFTDGQYQDQINCAACAGAVLLADGRDVKIGDKAFDIPGDSAKAQIFAQILPLIDQRMRGQISLNAENDPEYSLYSIAKAYAMFGYNSQALTVTQDNLPVLLEELPVGETIVVHVVVDGMGHYVGLRKDTDGYFMYDLKYAQSLEEQGVKGVSKYGIEELFNVFTANGYELSGNVLVGQVFPGSTEAIQNLIAANQVRPLDLDGQLDCLGACGTTLLFPIKMGADYNTVLNLSLRSLLRIDYRGSDSHSLQVTYRKLLMLPDDDEPKEHTVVRTFKAAYNTITQKIEILIKEVIDDKTITYLKRKSDGTIENILPPTAAELKAQGITLPQWEMTGPAKTEYTGFQVEEYFGEGLESDRTIEESIIGSDGARHTVKLFVGPYGPQIKGLKSTNLKSYMPQLMDRIVKTYTADFDATTMIYNVTGQVRWATHGESNVIGAHPHTAGPNEVTYDTTAGTVSVVHNGVFYNYDDHRRQLQAEGHKFKSPVDTEVFSHLIFRRIHTYKYNNKGVMPETVEVDGVIYPLNLKFIVGEVLKQLEKDPQPPTYSLQITSTDFPGEVVTAKRISPVYLALSDERYDTGAFIQMASDPKATIHGTKYYTDLLDDGVIFNTTENGINGTRIVMTPAKKIKEQQVIVVLEDGTFTNGQFTQPGVVDFKRISVTLKNKKTGETQVISNIKDITLDNLQGKVAIPKEFAALVKPKGVYNDGKYEISDEKGNTLSMAYVQIGRDRPDIFERGMHETFTEKELSQSGIGIDWTVRGNTSKFPVLYVSADDIAKDAPMYNAQRLANIVAGFDGEKASFDISLTAAQRADLANGNVVKVTVKNQDYYVATSVPGATIEAVPQTLYFDPNSRSLMSLGALLEGYAGPEVRIDQKVHELTDEELASILKGETLTRTIAGKSYSITQKPTVEQMLAFAKGKQDYLLQVDFKTEIDEKLIPSLNIPYGDLKNINKIVLMSTGSSFNADTSSIDFFRMKGVQVITVQNDYIRDHAQAYLDSLVTSDSDRILVVLTSQSGTTQSAVLNAEYIGRYNKDPNSRGYGKFILLADTNTPGSMITERTDGQINEHTGPEIAVASQKAVHAQMTNKFLLSLLLRRLRGEVNPLEENIILSRYLDTAQGLISLLDLENTAIDSKIDEWADRMSRLRAMFVVYRGSEGAEGTGAETVLKFQELARVFGTPIQAGLFLHGPVALVEATPRTTKVETNPVAVWDPKSESLVATANLTRVEENFVNTPILTFYIPPADPAQDVDIRGRFESNLQSLIARGAKIYLVTTLDYGLDLKNRGYLEDFIPIDSTHDAVALGQRLAVRIAKAKVKKVAEPLLKHARTLRSNMDDLIDPNQVGDVRNNLNRLRGNIEEMVKTVAVLRDTDELADLPNTSAVGIIMTNSSKTYAQIMRMLDSNLTHFNGDLNDLQLYLEDLLNDIVTLARAIDVDRPKDLAKSVTVENQYSVELLDALQSALRFVNLEDSDIQDILRRGPYELTQEGKINARPTRILDIIAGVQDTTTTNVVNENLSHELREAVMKTDRFERIPVAVAGMLSQQSQAFLKDRFEEFFFGGFPVATKLQDSVREVIAKVYTHKLVPDVTSQFFQQPEAVVLMQELDRILPQIDEEFFAIINPVGVDPTADIDRIMGTLPQYGVNVDDLKRAIVDGTVENLVNTRMNAEVIAAIRAMNADNNFPLGTEDIATYQSDRIKADIKTAQERQNKDLNVIPNIIGMNAEFFVTEGVKKYLSGKALTEGEGIADSSTFGIAQKIKEFTANEQNMFVLYSWTRSAEELQQIIALHGIPAENVVIFGKEAFAEQEGDRFDPTSASTILALPALTKGVLGITDFELEMRDFTIIDSNPDVAEIAMYNLANVINSPQGFKPDDLTVGQEVDLGFDAFELAKMLDTEETLPEDLIITDVSSQNEWLKGVFEKIKEDKTKAGQPDEVSLQELRTELGLSRFNREDLKGVRVKRKLTIKDEFIRNLKAQRALDISA